MCWGRLVGREVKSPRVKLEGDDWRWGKMGVSATERTKNSVVTLGLDPRGLHLCVLVGWKLTGQGEVKSPRGKPEGDDWRWGKMGASHKTNKELGRHP